MAHRHHGLYGPKAQYQPKGRSVGSERAYSGSREEYYSADEVEFMMTCDEWKRLYGQPTAVQVLRIAKWLGYRKGD